MFILGGVENLLISFSVTSFSKTVHLIASNFEEKFNFKKMPRRFVRESKFRHVFGSPHKKTQCYENVNISKNSWDGGSYCAVNSKFIALVLEGNGGNFFVLPIDKAGRVESDNPKVSGHKGKILDVKFNPFNTNVIASAGEDSRIKIWTIPEGGVTNEKMESIIDLVGHRKKVGIIQWHPTANNILVSGGSDNDLIIWDIEKGSPVFVLSVHTDQITSITWNTNGSLLLTTCKDKMTRVIDPRKSGVEHEWNAHEGNKPSRAFFVDEKRIVTVGTTRDSSRQIKLWNIGSFETPLAVLDVDHGTGNVLSNYDRALSVLYVASKGDCTIRYFEISEEEPYLHYLSQYSGTIPQRGFGVLPKNALNVNQCEIFRFYKLTSKNTCEPISMIVPRKSDCFQPDIYPDVPGDTPSLTAAQWLGGENAEPILISLENGFVPTKKEFIVEEQKKDENLFDVHLKTAPKREEDLRKAFYEQQDDLAKLREILKGKELRIRQLEYENTSLRKGSTIYDDIIKSSNNQKVIKEEISKIQNNREDKKEKDGEEDEEEEDEEEEEEAIGKDGGEADETPQEKIEVS